MRVHKEQNTFKLLCIDCGIGFTAQSRAALRCPECRKHKNCERSRESRKKNKAKRKLILSKSPLHRKSIQQVLQEVAKYNYEHKTHLTYGQYVNMVEEKEHGKKANKL